MAMSTRFEIFPSDLDATAEFYTRVLGFDITADRRNQAQPYLGLARDSVRIGATWRPPLEDDQPAFRRPPTGVEVVLEVDDVSIELDRVRAAGWPVAEDLQTRPWGLRDFRVCDPSGYYLRVTDRRDHSTARPSS